MAGIAWLVVGFLLAWAVWAFNRLVRQRNQMRTAWADIDVQLTRRHDLVPQLVATVKGYADHESALLATVTGLRQQALAARGPARLGEVESALELALARLFALREAYPELKASDNFIQLQRDLVQIEDQLQYARRFYNGAVRDYNDTVQRFPDLLVAGMAGFRPGQFYQAADEQRAAVPVSRP